MNQPTGDQGTTSAKMQLWQRKLLDFSMRNNFLNLRMRGRIIPLADSDISSLKNTLQDGAELHVESIDTLAEGQQIAGRLKQGALVCSLDASTLEKSLKTLHRTAKVAIEENGANSLYIAIGMLQWYEAGNTDNPRLAPLMLLPVELVRRAGGKYILRMRDEDIASNITLVEMMRQQMDIDLSVLRQLPLDEHGIDVSAVISLVNAAIADKPTWKVVEKAALGLFSFSKFVMWNDIHTGADKMMRSPVIQTLVEGKLSAELLNQPSDSSTTIDARQTDRTQPPKEFSVPLDVDSSQLEAVIDSAEGRSFILYGPPGTGKSQTITNMIANSLYHGRRVLFVAEKMAALSVVQRRLEKIGIGAFCLEMHSNKATKTHFLNQMEKALEVAHDKSPADYEALSQKLFDTRQQLIAYMDAVHTRHDDGFSLYDCILGALTTTDEIPSYNGLLDKAARTQLEQTADKVRSLDALLQLVGPLDQHPLRELRLTDTSTSAHRQLSEKATAALTLLDHCTPSEHTYQQMTSAAADKRHLDSIRDQITAQFGAAALTLDRIALRISWQETEQKWMLPRTLSKRTINSQLKQKAVKVNWENIPQLCDQLDAYEAAAQQLTSAGITDIDAVCAFVNSMADLPADIATLRHDELRQTLQRWTANAQKLHDWSLWQDACSKLHSDGLDCVVDYISSTGRAGTKAASALLRTIFVRKAENIIDTNPLLQNFSGLMFEQMIEQYRSMARQFQNLTQQELYARLASRIPNLTIEAAASSEVGILKRNIKSKGRGSTIRSLVDQIPTLLPRLCPVMLMSPISVAQYIDLDREPFDIVMFDEASQMPTSEAVGAIARAKALVCVGDPKQMPPTAFFATQISDDETADIDDMESILDDCITLSMPARYLTWHYRSKHESLIAFSNSQYYDGKLFTFPSVDDRQSKVNLVHVDGVYDMGKTRQNRAEAEAIVDEVVRRLADDELSQRSIGVVSFSKVQQDLIEDLLEARLASQPELERRAYECEEPIFVKNLENVQGDERDVILFSVGYGPDADGKVSMNFGPLNNVGGERRLNVAVSRARYEMLVFSTLRPEQIDLSRTQAEGVRGLKHFLEFASQRGSLSVSHSSEVNDAAHSSEQAIIQSIAAEISAMGYKVDTRVGRSDFKIDLAVVDPDDEGRYLLGLLLDGSTYVQTKTCRDREICQPNVLTMLGWKILKIWSIEWFLQRQAVLSRIKAALDGQPISVPTAPIVAMPATPAETPSAEPVGKIVLETADRPHMTREQQQILRVIAQEQPVTVSRLNHLMAEKWGEEKVNSSVRSRVQKALHLAYLDPLDREVSPYYWASLTDSIGYKAYRINTGRDISEVPLIEIVNFMLEVVQQSVAIPISDLARSAARNMGFQRITPRINETFQRAIARLVATGQITVTDSVAKPKA